MSTNSLAQVWLKIWYGLTLRDSPQWKTNVSARRWTRTIPHTYQQVKPMRRTLLAEQRPWLLTQVALDPPPPNFFSGTRKWRWCQKFSVFRLVVQTESHLKPLTSIQCNLKWIQLDSVAHSVQLSLVTGTQCESAHREYLMKKKKKLLSQKPLTSESCWWADENRNRYTQVSKVLTC